MSRNSHAPGRALQMISLTIERYGGWGVFFRPFQSVPSCSEITPQSALILKLLFLNVPNYSTIFQFLFVDRNVETMAIEKLSAKLVQSLAKPGRYGDGGGLWLQVTAPKAEGRKPTKSWVLRYMLNGRAREMGLGPLDLVSLAEARTRTIAARKLLLDGIDPLEARREQRAAARLEAAAVLTFEECAARYIAAHESSWKNPKHRAQWSSTLKTYAYPVIGKLSVAAVDTRMVLKVIEPIWQEKPETASRLRGRIEAVLDWATVRTYRTGDNPARWKGHLSEVLPSKSKVAKVKHHAALPYSQVGAFMADLREQIGYSARALEFAILTAARTGEVIGATRSEIDLEAKVWIIPASRMKAEREHRIPLSSRAIEIIEAMPDGEGEYIFPGGRKGRPLSQMALLTTLRRMGRGDLTTHGFRSTFRDWCAEQTAYPAEAAELALAHTVSDKVEAAYRRGDMFEKRRRMMADWANYCMKPSAETTGSVVPIQRGGQNNA